VIDEAATGDSDGGAAASDGPEAPAEG